MNADAPRLADLRREYAAHRLSKADLDPDPIRQFQNWLDEAIRAEVPEPTAMSLATCSADGLPSSRIVLLKALDERGFFFFTNYASRKAQEIDANPAAALNVFWPQLERQVCVAGVIEKVPREESDAYFRSRPRRSQLSAVASAQSEAIQDRDALEKRFAEVEACYAGKDILPPAGWGGFVLKPTRIEFWQGRSDRLHDRLSYRQSDGGWRIERLSP